MAKNPPRLFQTKQKEGDYILFNFQLFGALATKAYNSIENHSYTLDEVLDIFEYYFQKYEDTFQQVHPNIRMAQITSLIERMQFLEDVNGGYLDISPESYEAMIDKHFETQYKSDYNINHFFSGSIRALRMYETCY